MNPAPLVTFGPRFAADPGNVLAETFAASGPVFRVRLGAGVVHFAVGPEANRFVLATHRGLFSNEKGWSRVQRAPEVFGRGLTFIDGEEHDFHRKVMNPAFRIDKALDAVAITERITEKKMCDWKPGEPLDYFAFCFEVTFLVAAEAFLGVTDETVLLDLMDLFRQLESLAVSTHATPERARLEAPARERIRGILEPLIARRRTEPAADVLSLLCMERAEGGVALSDEEVLAEANQLLLAGHISTSSLAAWLMYLLLRHPEYLAQIERDDVFDRVLLEAERLYPPLGMLPRVTVQDVDFAGSRILAGSLVLCSVLGGHRIPAIFADPDRFDPDRFAPPRQEHIRTPYALIGFSAGPRMCLGVHTAKAEIRAIAKTVLRNFRLALIPSRPVVCRYQPQAVPSGGMWVIPHPRKAGA